jgi:zinc-ribbon domain
MKKCQTCGNQNADDMRFCLNCGASLPDAPVVVNFGGSQGGQSNPGTNPYGQSMETQFGANRPGFQQPGFGQQQQYSMAAQHQQRSGGGSKKILIAVGGIAFLFLLILGAGAAIIGYNIMKDKPVVTVSPTPAVSPSASPSASPSPSASKSASPTPKPTDKPKSSTDMRAKFEKIWVDYNVTDGGEKGMRIHVKFQVFNMKEVDSKLIVYFQKSDGTELRNSNTPYSTSDGRVAAVRELKPGYDDTVYKDLDVFIPYTALGLSKGKYNLKMDADVALDDEMLVQHLGYHEFEFEQF